MSPTPMSRGQKNSGTGLAISKSTGSAVIAVETSRQEPEPSRIQRRVGESKVFSGEVVGGRDALRLPRNAEHRNGCYRCGGHDPTRILLKPKGVRED